MEDYRKRQENDRASAMEAKYDPKQFLDEYDAEKVIQDLRKGRALEAGERAMEGAADMSINSPERVSNYI